MSSSKCATDRSNGKEPNPAQITAIFLRQRSVVPRSAFGIANFFVVCQLTSSRWQPFSQARDHPESPLANRISFSEEFLLSDPCAMNRPLRVQLPHQSRQGWQPSDAKGRGLAQSLDRPKRGAEKGDREYSRKSRNRPMAAPFRACRQQKSRGKQRYFP